MVLAIVVALGTNMSDTLKFFEIDYQDESGDSPVFTWRTKAYDAEHAEMKFYDFDGDGWVILKIREIGPCGSACGNTEHSRMATRVAGA